MQKISSGIAFKMETLENNTQVEFESFIPLEVSSEEVETTEINVKATEIKDAVTELNFHRYFQNMDEMMDSRKEMKRKEHEKENENEWIPEESKVKKIKMSNLVKPEDIVKKEKTSFVKSVVVSKGMAMGRDSNEHEKMLSQDADERIPLKEFPSSTNIDMINSVIEEDIRRKIGKNGLQTPDIEKKVGTFAEEGIKKKTEKNEIRAEKDRKKNTEEKRNVRKPIVWEENYLQKRIKNHPTVVGIVAFSYHANPFEGVKSFTVSTFQDCVIKECCTRHWITKLNCLVKKMKITDLYVQGYRQSVYLSKHLNVRVYYLPKRDPSLICSKCFRKSCSIFKVQHFFKSFFGYVVPIECYAL